MLIYGRNFWKLHGRWLMAMVVGSLLAVSATMAAAWPTGRWPGGGSFTGLILGALAAAIFLFEVALVAKKSRRFRTARWLLSAQTWMKAHIWLGLLTVPLVVLHSGGRLGGTLTTVFVSVFAVVILSGVWGLVLQNLLPKLLLEAAPAETIYSQIDLVGEQYASEARRLVSLACGEGERSRGSDLVAASDRGAHLRGAARQVGLQVQRSPHPGRELPRAMPSPAIQKALTNEIDPYLLTGTAPNESLGSRQKNVWYFEDLRLRVAPELRALVDQLDELCERRRQLNLQRRLHFWLHNWMWIHLPLSVALLILLVAHVILALRFG